VERKVEKKKKKSWGKIYIIITTDAMKKERQGGYVEQLEEKQASLQGFVFCDTKRVVQIPYVPNRDSERGGGYSNGKD